MGGYISNFHQHKPGEPRIADTTQPDRADWITAHATATGLSIVEVERLWERFRQLGCGADGTLGTAKLQPGAAGSGVFSHDITTTFRDPDGRITFETFLSAMKWVETASLDEKIRAAFRVLNGGSPLSAEILNKTLCKVFPNKTVAEIQEMVDVLMQEMDPQNKGHIDEEAFTLKVKDMPGELVSRLLSFHIVPPEINIDAHRTFSSFTNYTAQNSVRDPLPGVAEDPDEDSSRQIPTDGLFRQITERIQTRDWHMLANQLGFTAGDIRDLEQQCPDDAAEQVMVMLQTWRQKQGPNAVCGVLETALKRSDMNDVAMILFP